VPIRGRYGKRAVLYDGGKSTTFEVRLSQQKG
jgi:hypothetical protein